MDYKEAWRVRKIQLIIINTIFLVIGIGTAIVDRNFVELFTTWIPWAWVVGTLVASFSKTGDRLSTLGKNVFMTWVVGAMGAALEGAGGMFFAFAFCVGFCKVLFGMCLFIATIVFELVFYPISSVYYFIKSRN